MKIVLPEFCVVALIGVSGSGKSTFARKHFKETEVISSDFCRALVSDDENNQAATNDAFDVLYYIAGKRLDAAKLTVIDATNVQDDARKPILELAKKHHCLSAAIVLDVPEKLCVERNSSRTDRNFGPHVIPRQRQQLRRSIKQLKREGFRYIYVLESPDDIENVVVERQKLWNNLKHESGPFDIIGDVHGCFDELEELIRDLGYIVERAEDSEFGFNVSAPHGRRAIFVGDLVDRGPKTPDVLRLAMSMVRSKVGFCVPGNHDVKLMRKLQGKDVRITHGLAESLEQFSSESEQFKKSVVAWIDSMISHYVFDEGKLVVAHAGMKEKFQGRGSAKVRDFALFGETTGETDEYGLSVRYQWANDYRGEAMVVYGHTPVLEPEWINRTICIDTGCVFGGKLTALRYPERELVSVPARKIYYDSVKPFLPASSDLEVADRADSDADVLDVDDVVGKRVVQTRLGRNVMIREENAIAALEIMSRFAVNPKWLVYLPPTMSPSETSQRPGLLEHPTEAFNYFLNQGVAQVVCEEKHMGSRAVVVVGKDEHSIEKRFNIRNEGAGVCYTRTGRKFFTDDELEREFIDEVRAAISKADLWNEFSSDWFVLDCELMPWSAKAQELIRDQYAAVGAAAQTSLGTASELFAQAQSRGLDVSQLQSKIDRRRESVNKYVQAYQRYCWSVSSLSDYKLAPFHLMASEKSVHINQNHLWHMQQLAKIADNSGGLIIKTNHRVVDLTVPESVSAAIDWWTALTASGGEGMVIKPLDFIATVSRGTVQPALKCRGSEYLRIIYGPEYDHPEYLERLRSRGLAAKRSLAGREFALGVEALERFVRHEPLYRVHECVFGVLALESEPVDPRL
ncbi:MAG TPA: polynucleotide kinase-phosphatase [Drouetiella sp.]